MGVPLGSQQASPWAFHVPAPWFSLVSPLGPPWALTWALPWMDAQSGFPGPAMAPHLGPPWALKTLQWALPSYICENMGVEDE